MCTTGTRRQAARRASLGDRLGGLGRLGRRGGRVELVLLRRLRVVVLAEVRGTMPLSVTRPMVAR